MARVALITHVVVPWDGQGRVVHQLARHLVRRGHAVTLVASQVDDRLARTPGVGWIRIPVPRGVPDPVRWAAFAAGVQARFNRARSERFDIVHLNGAIAPVAADVNTCHFVHSSWRRIGRNLGPRHSRYQRLVTGACALTERMAYRSAGAVVAVSSLVRDGLIRHAGVATDPVVIPTGVDADEFLPGNPDDGAELRQSAGIREGRFLALHVGDARSCRKNLDLAIAALARSLPHIHLAVLGEYHGGPYPGLARRLGVEHRVHFLGLRHDVARWLRAADAVLCLSHYEPASLVMLEAMAAAVPVVVTPMVGNGAFLVNGENGFALGSARDVLGAAAILDRLAGDPSLRSRVGAAARQTAAGLTWDRMGRAYEDLYESVLADRTAMPVRRARASDPWLTGIAREGT